MTKWPHSHIAGWQPRLDVDQPSCPQSSWSFLGVARTSGGRAPLPRWLLVLLRVSHGFWMKWALCPLKTVAWALCQRLILTIFWVFPAQNEEGSRGSRSFVLPQLILPLPCPDFWTFLFLVQPLTLNLEFIPRQTLQCDSNNNSGTWFHALPRTKGCFPFLVGRFGEIWPPDGGGGGRECANN